MVTSLNNTTPVSDNIASAYNTSIANVTAVTTMTGPQYAGRTLLIDNATGFIITLPAALGTGNIYRFLLKTTVSSGSMVIKVANTTDSFLGNTLVWQDGGATVTGFEIVAGDDTITWNGSTTGGIAGDQVTIQDVAAGLFMVNILQAGTGTEATPTSATV